MRLSFISFQEINFISKRSGRNSSISFEKITRCIKFEIILPGYLCSLVEIGDKNARLSVFVSWILKGFLSKKQASKDDSDVEEEANEQMKALLSMAEILDKEFVV